MRTASLAIFSLAALLASLAAPQANAGNVRFADPAPLAPAPIQHGGLIHAAPPGPVTPSQAEALQNDARLPVPSARTAQAVRQPTPMASAAATATVPDRIGELARALRGDPDLIYRHVHDQIRHYPIWGIQKGARGALLEGHGTTFDQAALLVELLRAAGHTAWYIKGYIRLNADQIEAWLGVDASDVCAVADLLSASGVPIADINASAGGTCPDLQAELNDIAIEHVWVGAEIDGVEYAFDPSFKQRTFTPGLDLAAITGYRRADYLATARSGALITTDSVQGLDRSGLRTALQGYSNALLAHLRANRPTATLADLIGGDAIAPAEETPLRQTTLPYQITTVQPSRWDAIPQGYSSYLSLAYQGISRVYTSDQLAGRRLTLSFDGTQPVLMLDGAVEAVGGSVAPGTPTQIAFSIVHGAYRGVDQDFTQSITAGGTYLIGSGWGPVGRGGIEHHRARLMAARDAGHGDDSEAVLGETLAMLSRTWLAQTSGAIALADRLGETNTLLHHQVGIAGYHEAAYVDLPGIIITNVHRRAEPERERAAFLNAGMHGSVLESTAVEQVSGVGAVSTVRLLDIAVRDGLAILDVDATNYNSVVPGLSGCASESSSFAQAVANGARLLLPQDCALVQGQWRGVGYYDLRTTGRFSLGSKINGGLFGGFGDEPQPTSDLVDHSRDSGVDPTDGGQQTNGPTYNDPIDRVHGHYLYARTDLTVGRGSFPRALSFGRGYSSGLKHRNGPLGRGWVHDLDISALPNADGFQALGEDSALDAAATVVETMIALDLLAEPGQPLDHLVIASLGKAWAGEQAVGNSVVVRQGVNTELFTRLPDGSWNPPPGNPARLIDNPDGTLSYETLNHARLDFDADGRAARYQDPTGIQVLFDYSGDQLTGVRNSLGRALTLSYTGEKVTAVTDGQRSIAYAYDSADNLTGFTDAADATTTFVYDQPGRLTRVFYPSHPSTPFLTNTYDSLGRVSTQTDANNNTYHYFFAGSRSEEVLPDGSRRIDYADAFGNITRSIDPVGRVTAITYDGQQRPIETTVPGGQRIRTTYDDASCAAQGRCTHNPTRLEQHPRPGSGLPVLTTSLGYEPTHNRLASRTDPRGNTWTYSYTARGEPLSITGPPDADGQRPQTRFGYQRFTAAGFPAFSLPVSTTRRIDAATEVTTSTSYDAANGHVPAATTIDPGGLALTTSYQYDAVGNLTQIDGPRTDVADITRLAYDAERRLFQTRDAANARTNLAYDADGRLIRAAAESPTGWLVSCRTHSPSGKLARAWGPAETASPDTCPPAAAPVPVSDYAYDHRDRLQRITQQLPATDGGPRISAIDYLADDQIAAERSAVGTAAEQTTARYSYTDSGQLASVQDANGNLSAYDYDGHDRLRRLRYPSPDTQGTASATDYEAYGYDAAGNLTADATRQYAYDLDNRLTAVTGQGTSASLGYDPAGRLIRTTINATVTDLLYDGSRLIAEYDAAGNLTARHIHGPGIDDARRHLHRQRHHQQALALRRPPRLRHRRRQPRGHPDRPIQLRPLRHARRRCRRALSLYRPAAPRRARAVSL